MASNTCQDDVTYDSNVYYHPDMLAKCTSQCMPIFPLWSGVMLGDCQDMIMMYV